MRHFIFIQLDNVSHDLVKMETIHFVIFKNSDDSMFRTIQEHYQIQQKMSNEPSSTNIIAVNGSWWQDNLVTIRLKNYIVFVINILANSGVQKMLPCLNYANKLFSTYSESKWPILSSNIAIYEFFSLSKLSPRYQMDNSLDDNLEWWPFDLEKWLLTFNLIFNLIYK